MTADHFCSLLRMLAKQWMYCCAICKVSYLLSFLPASSAGSTSRSVSKAVFRLFIRFLSRAFAARRRPRSTAGAGVLYLPFSSTSPSAIRNDCLHFDWFLDDRFLYYLEFHTYCISKWLTKTLLCFTITNKCAKSANNAQPSLSISVESHSDGVLSEALDFARFAFLGTSSLEALLWVRLCLCRFMADMGMWLVDVGIKGGASRSTGRGLMSFISWKLRRWSSMVSWMCSVWVTVDENKDSTSLSTIKVCRLSTNVVNETVSFACKLVFAWYYDCTSLQDRELLASAMDTAPAHQVAKAFPKNGVSQTLPSRRLFQTRT